MTLRYPTLAGEGLEGVGAHHPSQLFQTKEELTHVHECITLIGFTGQDAKAAATQTGKEVTRFSLATTRRYQQDSEWKEKTYWHDCVVYGGYAPFAAKLNKGNHILIEGELTYREYNRTIETETGAVNVAWPVTEIVVGLITILNRRRRENNQSEGAA